MLNEYPNIHKFGLGEKLSKDAKRIEIPSLFVSLYHHRYDQVVVSRCDSLIGSIGCASDHSGNALQERIPYIGSCRCGETSKVRGIFQIWMENDG